jgi:hypothetical protein
MLIPNLTIPHRPISIQTPKSHTPVHTSAPFRRMSSIPNSPKSHLRPDRQRRKLSQRSRLATAPKPHIPKPSSLSIHELLISQLGLGRRCNRQRRQRGRIWTQSPKPSLSPVYFSLTHLLFHHTELLTHSLQIPIRLLGQWHWWEIKNGVSKSRSCGEVEWLVQKLWPWCIQGYWHHGCHLQVTDSSVRGQMVNSRVRPNSTS